jgi:hypothetical protein
MVFTPSQGVKLRRWRFCTRLLILKHRVAFRPKYRTTMSVSVISKDLMVFKIGKPADVGFARRRFGFGSGRLPKPNWYP